MAKDPLKRSGWDIYHDLNTIRAGKMPTGAKAPTPARRPTVDPDPVEQRRNEMAERRNKGLIKDVNLPLSGAPPEVRARAGKK